jgi:GNAT superfamily N-acetyltransferase
MLLQELHRIVRLDVRLELPFPAVTAPKVEILDLTPDLWPSFEKLFGENGACGGCWCMSWRLEKGERWADLKGAKAKRRMKQLITSGVALGALAFVDEEPVGWCSYGPRLDYARLNRARTLTCDDADQVWSIPCFFIRRDHRGSGVATALLRHVLSSLAKRGAKIAEGYPAKLPRSGAPIPAAFAWTGTRSLFDACGFKAVGKLGTSKQRMRRTLSR